MHQVLLLPPSHPISSSSASLSLDRHLPRTRTRPTRVAVKFSVPKNSRIKLDQALSLADVQPRATSKRPSLTVARRLSQARPRPVLDEGLLYIGRFLMFSSLHYIDFLPRFSFTPTSYPFTTPPRRMDLSSPIARPILRSTYQFSFGYQLSSPRGPVPGKTNTSFPPSFPLPVLTFCSVLVSSDSNRINTIAPGLVKGRQPRPISPLLSRVIFLFDQPPRR